MKWASPSFTLSFVALSTMLLAGCIAFDEGIAGEEIDDGMTAEQALTASNALTINALTMNALKSNALTTNSLVVQALHDGPAGSQSYPGSITVFLRP